MRRCGQVVLEARGWLHQLGRLPGRLPTGSRLGPGPPGVVRGALSPAFGDDCRGAMDGQTSIPGADVVT